MKIRTAKQKTAAAAARKQAFLKTVSFVLAMAITLNILSMPAFANVSYNGGEENFSDVLSGLPSSTRLEQMYINRLFYGCSASENEYNGRTVLDGERLDIYEHLRNEIIRVAEGRSTETVFAFELSSPYDDFDVLSSDLNNIIRCLISDIPEYFYWCDKTKSLGIETDGYSDETRDYFDKFTLNFAVSEKYADKSSGVNDGRYLKADSSKIKSAVTAAENAQNIAAEYDDLTYYEKILAYKDSICDLAEFSAAGGSTLSDPWQIVNVFDDNPDTNASSEGFARAFQYLCDLGGVKCCSVTGNLSSGIFAGEHMWNIVVLQGNSYIADIASCDGYPSGVPDLPLLKGAFVSNSNACSFYLGKDLTYTYDSETLSSYTEDILTVSLEDYDPNVHYNHKVCDGADNCPDSIHGEHAGDVEWKEWDTADMLPDEAGNYYLTTDVTLVKSWVPADGTSLCLNGHTIVGQDINSSIVINTGTVFNLCDCTGGGKISGNNSPSDGGGVYNIGTFNMFSGKISENTAINGGGVYNIGIFNMYGGKISGNTALYDENEASPEEEPEDTETAGGDESEEDSETVDDDLTDRGTFNMFGGKLCDNISSSSAGGGVFTYGRIVLGGSAVIKNNTYNNDTGDIKNNLYVRSGIAVALDSDNPLSEKAYIGITTNEKPVEGIPVDITGENDKDYSRFFHSDDPAYKIINGENNAIQLAVNIHRHAVCEGADNCPADIHSEHGNIDWIPWESTTSLPADEGNYYLTDDVILTETWEPANGTSLCLNGYIVYMQEPDTEIIYTRYDFNLSDCTKYGKIRGNDNGSSGVHNSGTFNMYNGEISGNTANYNGGGVINDNTFNMYGGKIINNTASEGGGVYSYDVFNMYGGKISGNTANYEGGGVSFMDTFNMYGGKIVENTAEEQYGGVGVCYNYSGGVQVTLGGNAVIDNNRCGDISSNLCIREAVTIDKDNPLAENAHIGITTENEPTEDDPVYITGENDADYKGFFYSDNPIYRIKNDDSYAVLLSIDDSHKHMVCEGTGSCTDENHDAHTDIIWKAWSETDRLPDEAGNYYLTANVMLTESWEPADDTYLCLNGQTISAQNAASGIIYIDSYVTFNLSDCTGEGKIGGNTVSNVECGGGITNEGTFNMYGGEITGNTASVEYEEIGGGVYNRAYGIFNMYGGKITKNTAQNGAGVYNAGEEFNLYGGEISENTAIGYNGSVSCGGGVYSNKIFNMHGGVIRKNTADKGAGAYIYRIMNMDGGEISENTAVLYGGGVNIATEADDLGGFILAPGTLNMYGGKIVGNIAAQGGGVCAYENNVYGQVTLGGNPVIQENVPANLYVNGTITLDTDNPLSGDANIGITSENKPSDGNPVNITEENDEDYSGFFQSDDPEFKIICEENNFVIKLVANTYQAPHIPHKVCGTDDCTDESHEDISAAWTETDRLPDTAGNYYLVYNVTLTESWTPADGTTLCLNGHTIFAQNADSGIINIPFGTTFNLCDCTGFGKISGNSVHGGVFNEGTFNMYSGEISHNTSYLDGGGVNNLGEFNMYGGRIIENTADFGGGVFNEGTVNISGGLISGNNAVRGGGVENADIGTLNIYGGEIIGNTAETGGGVYTHNSQVTLGGNTVIRGNRYGDEPSNLYIYNGTITLSESTPLYGNARIGITTEIEPTDDYPVDITGVNNTDYSRFFYSDSPNYDIVNGDSNEILLIVTQPHILVYHEAVQPTCEESGNEEYWICEDCGKIYTDEHRETELDEIPVIDALGHKWKWTITVLPTETSGGEAEGICENDESHTDRVILPDLLDESVWTKTEDTESTCEVEGKRVYTNEEYGTVTVTLEKTDHEFEDLDEGWHADSEKHWREECKNCGTANPDTEELHVWDEGTISVEPTAESEGEMTYICEICGYTRTDTIPKLGDTNTEPNETDPPVTPPSDETEPPVTPPSDDTEPPITPPSDDTEPPVTPPSDDTEPPITPPSDETDPPVTPPSDDTEPPVTPPSDDTEPPVTPPSDETDPPVTPPSDETEPPVTPPSDETEPPVTPPSDETEPPVTPPNTTTTAATYHFVVPTTSGTAATVQTTTEQTTTEQTTTIKIDPNVESIAPFEFVTESTTTTTITTTTAAHNTTEVPEVIKTDIISKRVESVDYLAEISDSAQNLAYNILTQQERDMINSGSMIEVLLTIDKISTVSDTDSTAITEALNGYSLWQYFDISLYKIIDGTQHELSSTNSPVSIKIVIPEDLRESGMEYALVRVHDGVCDVMVDIDNSADTITFTSDRFSVYAFVYKNNAADENVIEDGYLNTGVDSYTSVFLAVGITALAGSTTLTVMGTGIIGMSEERKNRLYEKLIRWGKGGGKTRRAIALALVFLLLRYYYSVGVKGRNGSGN